LKPSRPTFAGSELFVPKDSDAGSLKAAPNFICSPLIGASVGNKDARVAINDFG
jgi:hypothetical protein